MLKYLQLPTMFDAARMQEEVAALSAEYWRQHYQKTQYEGDWTALALRALRGNNELIHSVPEPDLYQDTPLLQKCPYISEVISSFKCDKTSVRLMKLAKGSTIKRHRDGGLDFESGEARLHIPVQTNERVEFYLEEERIVMQAGTCWYLNLNLTHHVNNFGNEDRVHLVVDCIVNEWLTNLLNTDSFNRKEIVGRQQSEYSAGEKEKIVFALRQLNTETANLLADQLERNEQ